MSAPTSEQPPMSWRMTTAEERLNALDAGFALQVRGISKHDEEQAVIKSKVDAHESAIVSLTSKLDKVYWALIGLSATIAASAAGVIFTLGGSHP